MRIESKLSDISERPVTRPLRVMFATWPSMTAPRNCSGEFTVMVKRSPVEAVWVERSVSSVAVSIVPSGTTNEPFGYEVEPIWPSVVEPA